LRSKTPAPEITHRWPALSDGALEILTNAALVEGEWFVNAENLLAAAELVGLGLVEAREGDDGIDLVLTDAARALVNKRCRGRLST